LGENGVRRESVVVVVMHGIGDVAVPHEGGATLGRESGPLLLEVAKLANDLLEQLVHGVVMKLVVRVVLEEVIHFNLGEGNCKDPSPGGRLGDLGKHLSGPFL
jgi:hypothetical protein